LRFLFLLHTCIDKELKRARCGSIQKYVYEKVCIKNREWGPECDKLPQLELKIFGQIKADGGKINANADCKAVGMCQ